MTRLITLSAWATATYGDAAPKRPTLRMWAKTGKIYPLPEKHGREYFVDPAARYVAANDEHNAGETNAVVQKVQRRPAPAPAVRATDLIDRILSGRKTKTA